MIPVILEITHRTMITARRIKMRRRTTRVGGPVASTAALAAVIAVSLFCLFTVLTLLCAISVSSVSLWLFSPHRHGEHREHRAISVCQIAVVFFSFAFTLAFTFNDRRRGDTRSGRLPNHASPFISFT